jgi:holo-[acyl-carrier protein] synthase
MLTTGVDIVEIARIGAALDRFGNRFLNRIYTEREIAFCRGRVPELAARFAGKEAVMKALGTGVRGVSWKDIEILPRRGGKPLVYLHDRGLARSQLMGLRGEFAISLTHSDEFAIAVVAGDAETP